MPISKEVQDLLNTAKSKGLLEAEEFFSFKSLAANFSLFDDQIDYPQEKLFLDQIKRIKDSIVSQTKERDSIISIIDAILKELDSLYKTFNEDQELSEELLLLQKYPARAFFNTPTFVSNRKSRGSAEIKSNPQDYEFHIGRTTRSLVLRKKQKPQELKNQLNFVVGIVNCEVEPYFHDRTISLKTLEGASINDLEVFDVIHEFERLHGAGSFALLMLKIKKTKDETNGDFEIENDYDINAIISKYCQEHEGASSAEIRIIAESSDLSFSDLESDKCGIQIILDKIPFYQLVENGIKDIVLEIVSCNTIEKSELIKEELTKIAEEYKIKITTHFFNGYVQNDDSFLYMSEAEHKILLQKLTEAKEEGDSQKEAANISYESFVNTLQQAKSPSKRFSPVADFLHEDKTQKNARLIQVIYPGLLVVEAQDALDLRNYIEAKNVTIEDEKRAEGDEDHGDEQAPEEQKDSEPAKKGKLVKKKLVKPGVDVPHGKTIQWSIDYRDKSLEASSSSGEKSPDNSPKGSPEIVSFGPPSAKGRH